MEWVGLILDMVKKSENTEMIKKIKADIENETLNKSTKENLKGILLDILTNEGDDKMGGH
jgi:hypothetical protein